MLPVLWASGVLAVFLILMLLVLMLVLVLALVIQRIVVLVVVMQLPLNQKQTLRGRDRPGFRFLALILTLP